MTTTTPDDLDREVARLTAVSDAEAKQMTANDKKRLCHGCRDDFYNQPGNTPLGQCYSLEKARVVERTQVGWWQNAPYEWRPQQTLSCHHAPGQFAWINRDDVRIRRELRT